MIAHEYRGQGLVGDLIRTAQRLGIEHQAVNLHLLVNHDNAPARRAYEKAGFERLPLDVMVLKL